MNLENSCRKNCHYGKRWLLIEVLCICSVLPKLNLENIFQKIGLGQELIWISNFSLLPKLEITIPKKQLNINQKLYYQSWHNKILKIQMGESLLYFSRENCKKIEHFFHTFYKIETLTKTPQPNGLWFRVSKLSFLLLRFDCVSVIVIAVPSCHCSFNGKLFHKWW